MGWVYACCVQGCKNRPNKKKREIKFYSFPKEDNRRQQWLESLNLLNTDVDMSVIAKSKICDIHFAKSDFYMAGMLRKIRKDRLPTIHKKPEPIIIINATNHPVITPKVKRGTPCCVPGCDSDTNRSINISFHQYSKNKNKRNVWIKRIHDLEYSAKYIPSNYYYKDSRICGLHFNKSGIKSPYDRYPRFFPNKIYPKNYTFPYESGFCNEITIESEQDSLESSPTIDDQLCYTESISEMECKHLPTPYDNFKEEHSYSLPYIDQTETAVVIKELKRKVNDYEEDKLRYIRWKNDYLHLKSEN